VTRSCPIPNNPVANVNIRHGWHKTIATASNLHNGCGSAACYRTTHYRNGGKCDNPSNPFPAFIHRLLLIQASQWWQPRVTHWKFGKVPVNAVLVKMRGATASLCSHKQAIVQGVVSVDWKRVQNW